MLNSTYISLSTKQGRINPQACEWLNMQSGVIEVLVPDIPKSCKLRGCPNNCRIQPLCRAALWAPRGGDKQLHAGR